MGSVRSLGPVFGKIREIKVGQDHPGEKLTGGVRREDDPSIRIVEILQALDRAGFGDAGVAPLAIVDDAPDLVQNLEYRLKKEGFLVVTALNGTSALMEAPRSPRLPGGIGYFPALGTAAKPQD